MSAHATVLHVSVFDFGSVIVLATFSLADFIGS